MASGPSAAKFILKIPRRSGRYLRGNRTSTSSPLAFARARREQRKGLSPRAQV